MSTKQHLSDSHFIKKVNVGFCNRRLLANIFICRVRVCLHMHTVFCFKFDKKS